LIFSSNIFIFGLDVATQVNDKTVLILGIDNEEQLSGGHVAK